MIRHQPWCRRIRRRSPKGQFRAELLILLKSALAAEAGYRCEMPWCRAAAALDLHHVVKRSQAGSDAPDNLVVLCRRCHERTDLPRDQGRLEITALGNGRFHWSHDGRVMERQRRGA